MGKRSKDVRGKRAAPDSFINPQKQQKTEEEQESVETVTCDSCAATLTEEASVFTCGVPLCYDLCEGCYAGGVAGAAHTKSKGAAHTFVQER